MTRQADNFSSSANTTQFALLESINLEKLRFVRSPIAPATLAGMPDTEGGEAFPVCCDMVKKLNQLESEKTYFTRACPEPLRAGYKYCHTKTLVKVIMEHIPSEYDEAVNSVQATLKMKRMAEGDPSAGNTTQQDLIFQNFSEDWTPPYVDLRTALLEAYERKKKRWIKDGKTSDGKKVPAMMIQGGHKQPGSGSIVCYACGIANHKRGDACCKAKATDIWKGAPEAWKNRMKKQKGAKDKTKKNQGNSRGNDKFKKLNDEVCRNFTTGNGYCRFGDNCKFSHDKGGAKATTMTVKGKTKKKKKQDKKVVTMVM